MRFFTDHDAWDVRVRVDNGGHDGRVGDPQALDAMDLETVIDHSQWVGPHLARAHWMEERMHVLANGLAKRIVILCLIPGQVVSNNGCAVHTGRRW